jgi:hypothetical protein
MRTGATLGRGNARRDHPEARGIARTSPDRGRIDLAEIRGSARQKICCMMYVSIYTIQVTA